MQSIYRGGGKKVTQDAHCFHPGVQREEAMEPAPGRKKGDKSRAPTKQGVLHGERREGKVGKDDF